MVRRAAAALALLVLAAAPANAHASATQESIVQDDNLLLYRGDDVADRTLAELAGLGVDRVRLSVPWRSISDAGSYDRYDHVLRVARRLGIGVLFNVTGPGPDGVFKPNSAAFGRFVEALGRRYDGTRHDENSSGTLPRVTHWSIWNEPNQGAFLQPQWEKVRGRWRPASPRLYRRLVRAAVEGLARSGHGGDTVLLGETAPLGARRKGRTRAMTPGVFLRHLFCLTRAASGCDYAARGPLRVSGFAHHPYPVMSSPERRRSNPDEFALADRRRLAALLDRALRAGRLTEGLPLWFTEFGWQTRPPDPYRGVSLEKQARWIAEAERLTRADGRVAAHAQFLLRDDDPWMRYPAGDRRRWTTYQTGLRFSDGEPKPAYDAYRLPLVALDQHAAGGQPVRLWGLVRPAAFGTAGSVDVQWAPAGTEDWETVQTVAVEDPGGGFLASVTLPGAGGVRFAWTPPAPAAGPSPLLGPPAAPVVPDPLHSPTVRITVG